MLDGVLTFKWMASCSSVRSIANLQVSEELDKWP